MNDLIPKPKGWFGGTYPKCGQKLKIIREGPFYLGKRADKCGYEYVYELGDKEYWRVERWSKFYDWGQELP